MDIDRTAVAGVQITGSRKQQEDSYCIEHIYTEAGKKGLLLVLCDGMGGRAGGEIASRLVCKKMVDIMTTHESVIPWRLATAMEHANHSLAAKIREEPHLAGMGTTLVAAVILDNRFYWVSVGDSPLWLLRDGRLQRLNDDHSMKAVLNRQVEAGEITSEEAARDITRHYLLSAMCGTPPPMIDLPQEPFILQPGDMLLLASDGVETLTCDQLTEVVQQNARLRPAETLVALMAAIEREKNPHQDNASAVLVKMNGETKQEQPEPPDSPVQHETESAGQLSKAQIYAISAVLVAVVLAIVYVLGKN